MSALKQHRLATEASERFRPFFNVDVIAYLCRWSHEIKDHPEGAKEMYSQVLDGAQKIVHRCKELGIEAPMGRKTTYTARIEQIDKNVSDKKDYVLGSKLLLREVARIMCSMRAGLPQVTRIDTDRAVELLHQSFRVMMNDETEERKIVDNNNTKIQIGIGSWGEVFFEKHQGDAIEVYLYSGIFSDLFCSFLNKYIVDGDKDSELMMFNLLEFASIHPAAEKSLAFLIVVDDVLKTKESDDKK